MYMHDSTWPHRTSWREKTNQLIAMRKQIGCSSGILILHTIAMHRRMIMKNCLREKGKFELGIQFSSVQFSRSVISDSLRFHEPQHAMDSRGLSRGQRETLVSLAFCRGP